MHCDSLTKAFDLNKNLYNNPCQVNLKKLLEFNSIIQVFAIWLDKKYLNKPFENAIRFIKYYLAQIKKYKKYISHKKKFFLGLEGGEPLENNIYNLEIFYNLGVRFLTLTWNNENNLAGGTYSSCGLKKFGYEILDLINNKLNIIIDVSHASKKTFWDTYKYSKKTFIASHSNSKFICDHIRNLDDDQILAIKQKNGLIGLNLYSCFIKKDNQANLKDLIKHVDHLLYIIGDKNICFGCDFDGADIFIRSINSILDIKKPYNLFKKLYGPVITNKIFYTNIKRFLTQNKILD